MTAPRGTYPLVRAFAVVVISGVTSQTIVPNHSPNLPNPVITSSAIITILYFSVKDLIPFQYDSGAKCIPAEVDTGSAINAAIVSGSL